MSKTYRITAHDVTHEYDPTGLVCMRCTGRVFKSLNPEYVYQCFEHDEDLYGIEVMPESMLEPIVEGTKEDTGFKSFAHCDEYCPHCEQTTYNIPDWKMSLCAHCGAELFPCANCNSEEREDGCQWSYEDFGCQRFIHSPAWIEKERKAMSA